MDESEEKFKKGERREGERQDLSLPSHLPSGREAGSAPRLLAAHDCFKAGADRIWQPETCTEQALRGNGDSSR